MKKLNKYHKKKIDSRKGVLLASYSRKKTRKRKKGKESENNGTKQQQQVTKFQPMTLNPVQNAIVFFNSISKNASRSITPSPRESVVQRPQVLAVQRTRALGSHAVPAAPQPAPNPNVLHPMGVNYRGQLLPSSRQASSNASEGGANRESSLDDSGVVDDHEDQDHELTNLSSSADVTQRDGTPFTTTTVTAAASINPGEVQVVKCNGNIVKLRTDNMCTYQPEYLSQIVILGKQWRNAQNCHSRFLFLNSICWCSQMMYQIEIALNVCSVALTTKDGCSSKIVCTRYECMHLTMIYENSLL